jgi:GNAT superfamily N-acetyltransferase
VTESRKKDKTMSLQFMKAGTADALVLNAISKRAFDSDVQVGAPSAGGPPGYMSLKYHMKMAGSGHLFKLVDEAGVILGGAILFRQGDALNVGRIFIDPHFFRKGYGIFMMREIESMFPEVKVFTLDTPGWNTRTNAFYTKLGYSEVKRDSDFIYYSKNR